jgi:hypothetical protein
MQPTPAWGPSWGPSWDAERAKQAALLRDIFGNPWRPAFNLVSVRWGFNDGIVIKLAQQMYDTRDFTAMPILADALEESGCEDEDILRHCRQPGEHVRGCWVVDLLLSKE